MRLVQLPRRFLHYSSRCFKDEKSKQMLKDLGLSLQKGQINHDDAQSPRQPQDEGNPVDSNSSMLGYYYDTISHMSDNDLFIQQHCDNGRQLFASNSQHFLDRKAIFRELPSEIDLFDPKQVEQIDKIYKQLEELDEDKTVHMKYYKRYLNRYDDPVQLLIQDFNGIDKKFKLLRRKEIEALTLAPGAYLYHENLFRVPYNVVGFDRSISGLPLRKDSFDKCYPQEFIEDLQSFRTKIPVHKRDLDFVDVDESTVLVDPKKVTKSYHNKMKRINRYLEQLDAPQNSIKIANIEDFHQLHQNPKIIARIESEILLMRKMLTNEIQTVLKAGSPSTRQVELSSNELKTNLWRMCESKSRSTDTMFEFRHLDKEFNMLPNFAHLMRSVKHRRKLKQHLARLFVINLEEQVDILTRIKYLDDRSVDRFLRRLVNMVNNVIKYKLMRLFKPATVPPHVDALIYHPYDSATSNFRRIHWLNRWKLARDFRPVRRTGMSCNSRQFDDFVE